MLTRTPIASAPQAPKRRLARWTTWVAVATLGLTLLWFVRRSSAANASEASTALNAPTEIYGIGSLQATSKAEIAAKTVNRVVEIDVEAGSEVQSGAPLAALQNEPAEAALRQARATIAADEAASMAAAADLLREQRVRDKAREDLNRLQLIARRGHGAVAPSDLEAAAATADEEDAACQRLAAVESEARQATTAAQAAADAQQTLVDDNRLVAPFAGLVTQRLHSVGDSVAPGDSIVELVDPSTLYVAVQLDESFLGEVAPGQSVRLGFHPGSPPDHNGTVLRIDRAVDRDTREFVVEVGVVDAPRIWALNQRVDAYIARTRTRGTP